VRYVLFDKTGTLTQDDMELKYVAKANSVSGKLESIKDKKELNSSELAERVMLQAMSTCHSLIRGSDQ
jgi:magnesium-transporting ATPase (P-type)